VMLLQQQIAVGCWCHDIVFGIGDQHGQVDLF
jgi:hypothetical protein